MMERARTFVHAARLRLSLLRLERGIVVRDPFPLVLFMASFVTYFAIGQSVAKLHVFDTFDLFFNADCPRVFSDLAKAHRAASSIGGASSAHPLFLILWNPLADLLASVLGRDELLGALVLIHAVSALGNVFAYLVLRRLGVSRTVAALASVALSLSTSQLVFGSIVETYAFALFGLLACILVSLAVPRSAPAALAHVLPFGANVVLGPYSLLAAPTLWMGRLSPRHWIVRTLWFWILVSALVLFLMKVQHEWYPDTNFFHRKYFEDYLSYSEKPADIHRYARRWVRLFPHLFAFDVVAPVSLFTGPPSRITTFMWEQQNRVAWYPPFGGTVALAWAVLFLVGLWGNLRGLIRGDRSRVGFRLLCLGWFVGMFGLFTFYGDDLELYSELWVGHVVLFVALGLSEYFTEAHTSRWRAAGIAFLSLLALNNFRFVAEVLARYRT